MAAARTGSWKKKGGEPVKVSPHFQGQRWEKLECGGCERAAGHAACHRRHILEENKGESAPRKEGRKERGEGEEKVAGALSASIILTAVWSGNTQER